ncbi:MULTISPECIES: hypothetical protein [Pseudomonas]|jgi:hypothetical protein|uniref:Transcriptional regulator SutA RNAP-binding domain-containing protein n=2 Tax=Pseudomonas putida group TaxID=136845 RepID=A0AAE6RDE6_9PSED|nr:hypothetical protein CHR29_17630 [Pseudomonas monteilii]AYN99515.1 hypothetical protein D8767_11245 [Pseudomonas sp. LTGT-11-2Z]KPM64089.1 hypothetical protein HB4184_10790 [Pseudomonas putida]MBB3272823.1 hypothetical protein [Pseudomonas sp. OG7]PXX72207.1 hypothetical protein D906_00187 [Pseudomonas sp. LAIL14HWK12:I1]SMC54180.1 hypothetical protein SAMN05660385_01198 [Pseudomonas sp. URIL14HWK12:I5]SNB63903.1 hypothetical protein SAMN02745900_01277 [Pseudomonas sp. URIL14HWK12:I8]SNS6
MLQAISPETQRAHERLNEQTQLFVKLGGQIESVPAGVSGVLASKPKSVWTNPQTAKSIHKR